MAIKKYKKISFFVLSFILIAITTYSSFEAAYAQITHEWATSYGGTGQNHNYANSIVSDSSGNTYIAGQFYGTIDFDQGPGEANLSAASASSPSGFILKLDANGDYVWVRKIENISFLASSGAQHVALDSFGNVYVTGFFQGTQDFDSVGSAELTSNGSSDVFILKLDSSGGYIWAKGIGGSGNDGGRGVTIDSSGNVYTTGTFSTTVDFDPGAGTVELTSAGFTDSFILKLDTNGDYVWAKAVGAAGAEASYGLTVDSLSNVYTVGNFNGTVDFDPGAGTANLVSAGNSDGFILKLDTGGDYVWAKRIGGADFDYVNSITMDTSNHLYITTAGSVAKLDSLGEYVWTKAFEVIDGEVSYSAIGLDASNNVYTTGTFYASIDFDPGVGVSTLTSGNDSSYDIFITKFDSDGGYLMSDHYTASAENTFPSVSSIEVDVDNNIYTVGNLYGALDFDPGVGEQIITSRVDYLDMFIAKLSHPSPPPPLLQPPTPSPSPQVSPIPEEHPSHHEDLSMVPVKATEVR